MRPCCWSTTTAQLVVPPTREEGIGVLECGSGEEAVELARERRPSLVLLDVRLPGIDGFEVLRRFEAAGMNLPVIMLTSLGVKSVQLRRQGQGVPDRLPRSPWWTIAFTCSPPSPSISVPYGLTVMLGGLEKQQSRPEGSRGGNQPYTRIQTESHKPAPPQV